MNTDRLKHVVTLWRQPRYSLWLDLAVELEGSSQPLPVRPPDMFSHLVESRALPLSDRLIGRPTLDSVSPWVRRVRAQTSSAYRTSVCGNGAGAPATKFEFG
jgi:hypothetical protein